MVGSLNLSEAKASTITPCEFVASYIDYISPAVWNPTVLTETVMTDELSYCVIRYDTVDLYGEPALRHVAVEYNHVLEQFVLKYKS